MLFKTTFNVIAHPEQLIIRDESNEFYGMSDMVVLLPDARARYAVIDITTRSAIIRPYSLLMATTIIVMFS